jgi:uncharacterized protein YneF (UPF0154 family)
MPLVLIIGIVMIAVGLVLGIFITTMSAKYRREQQAEAQQNSENRR